MATVTVLYNDKSSSEINPKFKLKGGFRFDNFWWYANANCDTILVNLPR